LKLGNEKFNKSIVILVEGKTDKIFFEELIKFIGRENDFQVVDIKGKDKLKNIIKFSDFSLVKILVVVQDADNDPKRAFQSIRDAIKNSGFSIPLKSYEISDGNLKTAIIILPDEDKEGDLESLIVEHLKNRPEFNCVEGFVDCAKSFNIDLKKLSKAKLYAYISITSEPDANFDTFIKKKIIDFNDERFKKLIDFIKSLQP
jgi:predicted ATP-dependent endonuclease of OLD family